MFFKKLFVLSFIVTMAVSAPSRIVVAAFKNIENANEGATKLSTKLKEIDQNINYELVIKARESYQILVIEPLENMDEINAILSIVRRDFKDAYVREIRPDLQKEVTPKDEINIDELANETEEEIENKNIEAIFEEKEAITQESTPKAEPVTVKNEVKEPLEEDIQKQLTLQETVKSMLITNPGMQEAIKQYLQTGKDLEIANHGYYPTLDLSGTYGFEKRKSPSSNGEFNSGVRKETQLTFTQNIYDGGATKYRIHQEQSRLDAAAYSVAERADRLSLQMVETYISLIRESKLLELSKYNVQTHKEIYSQIKDRVSSGFGRASEERQAGSRLTLAESNLIAQENNYHDAINRFYKLSGLKVDPKQLVSPLFNIKLPEHIDLIREKAFTCNPSILVQKSNIELAQHIKDGTKSPFRPTLSFEAYARVGDDLATVDGRDDTYAALLRFNYNLYNRGIDTLEEEKAQVLIQQEKYTLENLKRDLDESLHFSWKSYVLNNKKLEFLKEHENFSKETLEAYKEEFKIGRRDLINLLDAESEYYSARRENITTQSDYMYAKYRLLDNMGFLADSFDAGFAKRYIKGACSIKDDFK